jgi:L-cystine uptake protein TcyP (sodium:dicarboxylate symporter family)
MAACFAVFARRRCVVTHIDFAFRLLMALFLGAVFGHLKRQAHHT